MDISSAEEFAVQFRGTTISGSISRASAPERVEWIARRARAMSNAPSQDRIKEVGDDAGALADYLESTDSGALFDVQIQELSSHLREIRGLTVDGKGLDECEDRAEFCKCLPHALRAAALDARYGTDPLSDGDQGNLRSGLAKP